MLEQTQVERNLAPLERLRIWLKNPLSIPPAKVKVPDEPGHCKFMDWIDPRTFKAYKGPTEVRLLTWRGVTYVRDDADTTTPDSSDTGIPSCIVSQDGIRFKPEVT